MPSLKQQHRAESHGALESILRQLQHEAETGPEECRRRRRAVLCGFRTAVAAFTDGRLKIDAVEQQLRDELFAKRGAT